MNKLFSKIFMWLGIGLFISFGVAFYVSTNSYLIEKVFTEYYVWFLVIELAIAFGLGLFVRKLSKRVSQVLYIAYSAITGFTLSSIFLVYELYSIIFIFLITSIIFIALAIYGYNTSKDITKIGTILFFGLIGVVLVTILNLFLKSSSLDFIATIISVIIFVCYITYDVHVIKRKLYDIEEDKLVVYGAFQLYLDFINLFLDLLRLFVKSKD